MPELDLARYLHRIGIATPPPPTADGLAALHEAHATHIPFENVDVLLGRRIRLDIDSLQAKLVGAQRGGYCFEHNMLFAAALESIGFRVTRLAARVRYRTPRRLARTHMLLKVDIGREPWIADVGFGGSGLLQPLRLQHADEQQQYFRTHRLVDSDGTWTLQGRLGDNWEDYYAFTLEPYEMADFEMANHYVSTHPDSPFVQRLTVQRPLPDVRHVLRGRELSTETEDGVESRLIGDDELPRLLSKTFALEIGEDIVIPREKIG